VIAYDDAGPDAAADAVAIANDSRYGLVGAVWSADEERAAAVAARLQVGSVAVNSTAVLDFGSPFGGFKQSGIGREECFEEMLAYTQEKNIHLRLKPAK